MKDKRKKRKKLILWGCSIGIILFLILFYIRDPDRTLSGPERFFKDIVVNIEKVLTYPTYQQNKKSESDQSESYVIQKNMNDTLVKEIEELKKILELNQTFTDYEIVNATILSRNKSYWFQNVMIDKGKNDDLKEEMIVITKDGLIGKLSKVSNTTSEVKLITTNDFNYKVSVEIIAENGNIPALLNGFDQEDQTLLIEGVDNQVELKEGQVVITSGLGGVFPRGIYIGTVEKIESDRLNISKKVKVKTKQNFNDIHYVSVLRKVIS